MQKKYGPSRLFAVLAAAAMLLAVVLTVLCLDAEPLLLKTPNAARNRVDAFMTAVCSGDYDQAQAMLYGRPDLGLQREPADTLGVLLREAFQDSTDYSCSGSCYVKDSQLRQDVSFVHLDLSSVTGTLKTRAEERLSRKVSSAEDMSQIYDEENNYREELVREVLEEVTREAITEDASFVQKELSLPLVYENGQWWILPEQTLLDTLFGDIGQGG